MRGPLQQQFKGAEFRAREWVGGSSAHTKLARPLRTQY